MWCRNGDPDEGDAGRKAVRHADLSSIWIIATSMRMKCPWSGRQTAVISLSYFPDKDFTAKIDYIYTALSGDTRTSKIQVHDSESGGKLKPRCLLNVEIKIGLGKKLAIP